VHNDTLQLQWSLRELILFTIQKKKHLTGDLNSITKEISYLVLPLNSNYQQSFRETTTPKCTNNQFQMKDKINTSGISTKEGGIVNMKWWRKSHNI